MLYDDLRAIALFDGFSDDQVAELAADGEELTFEEGERLFEEGRPADHWWLLLEGSIDLMRRIGHEETVLATMQVPGQWAVAISPLSRWTAKGNHSSACWPNRSAVIRKSRPARDARALPM